MRNRFFGRQINFSHFGRVSPRLLICAILIFFEFFGAWGAEKWSGVKNDRGDDTNYRSNSGGYTFNLTGDTWWNGNLILAADSYDVVINLNGYSLYIYRLCIGWIDSSVSYKLNLKINGPGTVTIDKWQLSTYGDKKVSHSNTLSVTGNAVYNFPSNGSSYFASGYNTSGGISAENNKFYWTGAGSDKNWTTGKNWYFKSPDNSSDNSSDNTHYPGESGYADKPVYFLGTEAANVILNETITLESTLYINSAGEKLITFDLNGQTLTVESVILNAKVTATSNSNMSLTGSGSLVCKELDYPHTKEHTVTIKEDCELKITETFYGDGISGFMLFTGAGTLSIPGSGANLNSCCGNKKKNVIYTKENMKMKNITASCPPSYYTVSFSGAQSFSNTSAIKMTLNNTGACKSNLAFPYSVKVKGSGVYDIDGTITFSSDGTGEVKLDTGTGSSFGAGDHNHTIKTSTTAFTDGDGFTITLYAPDGSGLVLGSVSWKKNYPTWTGTTNSDWTEKSNWTGISELITGESISWLSSLSGYNIVLTNGLPHYPEINGSQNITVGSLEIEGGAKFKVSGGSFTAQESIVIKGEYDFGISDVQVSGGTLTAGKIEVKGNSEFSLSGGGKVQTDELYINGNNVNRKTEFKFSGGSLVGKTDPYANFKAVQNACTDLSVDSFVVNNFTLSDEGVISPLFFLNRTVLTVNGVYFNNGGSVYTKMRYSEDCSVAAETADAGTWVFVAPEASDKWVYVKPVKNLSYNDVIISLSSIKQTCIGGNIKANSIEINTSGGSNDSLVVFSDCTVDSPVSYTLSQDGLTFLTTYTTSSSESYHAIEFKQTVNTNAFPLKTSGEGSVKFSGAVTAGSLSADTEVTLAADITVSGAIDFSKAVTSEGPVTITADGNITFTDELLVSGMLNLISGVAGTPETVIFTSTVDSEAGGAGSITVGSEEIPSLTELNKSVGSNKALDSILLYGAVTVESGCSLIKTGGVAGKYAEFKGGFSGTPDILLTGNAEIYGDNSFSSLKIDNSSYGAETTVKFEGGKTQTVTSEFSVLGADSKPVNLLSSSSSAWKIDVTAAVAADPTKINVSYAAVENSNSIYDSIIAENSTDKGKNTNWNFAGVEYVWKGINSSLWTDNGNWEPATVPGSKAYAKIEAASNNPKLTLDIEAAKITVDSGAVLELQGYSVSLPDGSSASPTFVNSGTVTLFGLATQSVSGTKSNAPESLVEYNGTSSNAVTNAAWGSEYAKLVISSAADFSQDLNVSESLAISPSGTSSAVRLNGNVSAGSFSGAALNLTLGENCSEINIAGAASLTGSVTSSADSIVMSAGNWSVSDLSLTGKTVSVSGSFSTSEAFVCNAEAFFDGEFVQSGGTSTFRNNVSFSSYRTDDGLVIFDGQGAQSVSKSPSAASGAEISFADVQIGTASNTALELLAALDFTVSGKWESHAAFKASSGTATFTGDVEITGSSEFYGFCYKKAGGKLEFKNANKFETLEIDAEGAEVTFPAGQANCQVVSTYLKMCGKEGNFLTLKSSSGGSQWYIEFKGDGMDLNASYIYYIKISDSYAVKELVARESKNEYNNTNWIFPAMRFVLTLAKPDSNRLYLMFDRKIDLSRSDIKSTLVFLTEDGADSGLSIDSYSKYAETSEYTSILCTLNRNLTMADLTDVYIAYRSSGSSIICDKDGISPQEYYGHSITDFALDLITPLYGYDNRHTEYDAEQFKENINEGSWTIRNWDADQGTDGTLLLGTDILISVVQNISTPSEKLALYFDNKPASDSVSVELNKRTGGSYRLWIPSKTSEGTAVPVLDQLSEKTNDSFEKEVDDSGKKNINFVLKKSYFADGKMKSGDQVSFLFGLEDFEVCHEPKIMYSGSGVVFDTSEKSPLFSVRLKKSGDYSSVDLWSFRLKDVVQQRGGVTVMNNVINASSGEEAYIKVNMTETGPLSVVVMTLDGNVVQYLHHGTAVFGDHMFSWNGRTKSGKTVARGMYFIRVFGSGVEETRKVMVVKD